MISQTRSISSQYPENSLANLRPLRFWPGLILWCFLCSAPAVAVAGAQSASSSAASLSQPPVHDDAEEEIEELEEEVGDRDPTYLRTRAVVRYDHRLFNGSASNDRLRLRFLYAFGPKQRFAVSVLEPLARTDTTTQTARGAGDAEVQFNANVVFRERFRAGVGVQTTLQTASDALLGGATTTLKPSVEFAGVPASRLELVAAFYYKQSIHTSRGIADKQFEPDFIVNARAFHATWFFEWDSFYDVVPGRFAQTVKPGVSRAFGPGRRWVGSAYYAIGVNDYARLTQYRYDAGVDVTWYPWQSR